MTQATHSPCYSPRQLNRLHDQAHAEAPVLRREAIDAFWHAAWQWLALPHSAVAANPQTLRGAH